MSTFTQDNQSNKLIFFGLILFSLGLIVGLMVPHLKNPRMGLSGHLEGIMNGMFLMLLGLNWKRLLLSSTWFIIAFWLALYGAFANFVAVIIAAFTGFGKMMPIAGGQDGMGLLEGLISFLLISLALCMLAVCIIALTGLYRYMKQARVAAK